MVAQPSRQRRLRYLLPLGLFLFPTLSPCQQMRAGAAPNRNEGRALYTSNCADPHGADGAGTGHAPRLADNQDLRERPVERIRAMIAAGFPASGMPPFAALPAHDLHAVATYVRSFNTPVPDAAIQGETSVGENFFWGEGRCGTCHMVHGKGSSLGPDLSDVGHKMTSTQLHDLLLLPDLHITTGYHLATVKTRDGKTMEGFLRGRSNYDVQLTGSIRALHFLDAREISSLSEENRSRMKPLAASTSRLDDLTAYLSQLSGVEQGLWRLPTPTPHPRASTSTTHKSSIHTVEIGLHTTAKRMPTVTAR